MPRGSLGRRAADVQSRMESSLALPYCVGSARLTEYILVCVWKFNSCSAGTQKIDLQRETTPLFPLANLDHPFLPREGKTTFPPLRVRLSQLVLLVETGTGVPKVPKALTRQVTPTVMPLASSNTCQKYFRGWYVSIKVHRFHP